MKTPIPYKIHPKETVYFAIKIAAAMLGYAVLTGIVIGILAMPQKTAFVPLLIYAIVIILFLIFRLGFLVGYLKGNAIRVTQKQFPDIHEVVKKQCTQLQMELPDVYIMQQGGLLNAFATQFMGSRYIVIYSDFLEEAYQGNSDAVEFVIGHELGHIKRNHLTKRMLLFPAFIVPFLNRAYSRACEYTCDNIGAALNPQGARNGLLLLTSGKNLWRKVNRTEFIAQQQTESGFWHWLAEKVSTHPHLSKRLKRFENIVQDPEYKKPVFETATIKEIKSDHSAYLPQN